MNIRGLIYLVLALVLFLIVIMLFGIRLER